MGNSGTSSSKHVDLTALVSSTHLREAELRDLLKLFRRAAGASTNSPYGVASLSWKTWREICSSSCGFEDERLQRLVFRAFGGDGDLTFQSCASNLSILLRGTSVEKLSLCARALDSDGDGNIDRDDLIGALDAVLKLISRDSPAHSNVSLESQGGMQFHSPSAYAEHLLDDLGADEKATSISVEDYESGGWRSLDVFLATRLSPLTDVDD